MKIDFLKKAKDSQEARQKAIINAVTNLQKLTKDQLSSREINKASDGNISSEQNEEFLKKIQLEIISQLHQNQEIQQALMSDSNTQKESSFAFRTNKLKELFSCSENILNRYGLKQLLEKPLLGKLEEQNYEGFSFETSNKLSTSFLNCVQNVYLNGLSLFYNNDNFTVKELRKEISEYDIETSAVIQTTKLPTNYIPTNYTLSNGKIIDITNWFYYYKDDRSPFQGELVVPNLGYQFGGSRADERYDNKEFKSHDCSSYISSLLGFKQALSTADYELILLKKNADYNTKNISLFPVNNFNEIIPGDFFVTRTYDIKNNPAKDNPVFSRGGHIGIISKIVNQAEKFEDSVFETLSYNRDMPHQEGFIYENVSFSNANVKYYFFRTSGDVETNQDEF